MKIHACLPWRKSCYGAWRIYIHLPHKVIGIGLLPNWKFSRYDWKRREWMKKYSYVASWPTMD